jgi:hypothetical protein
VDTFDGEIKQPEINFITVEYEQLRKG